MKPPLDKPPFTADQLDQYRERFTLLASQGYWGALEALIREMRKRAEAPPEVLTTETYLASALDDVRLVNALEKRGILTVGQLQAALWEGELGVKSVGPVGLKTLRELVGKVGASACYGGSEE